MKTIEEVNTDLKRLREIMMSESSEIEKINYMIK